MIRVTVWNEYRHERHNSEVKAVYPEGIHGQIASFLHEAGFGVKTATLDEPEHGLTSEVLDHTDVLIWWGHMAHHEVDDQIVEKVTAGIKRYGLNCTSLRSLFKNLSSANGNKL